MAIEVIGTIKPKNNGKFPIVEAQDVSVGEITLEEYLSVMETPTVSAEDVLVDEDGTTLKEKLAELETPAEPTTTTEIPDFNLAALGMSAIRLDGTETILQTDTTEILAAIEKGSVRFTMYMASLTDGSETPIAITPNIVGGGGQWMCTAVVDLGTKLLATIMVQEGVVAVWLSAFESAGSGESGGSESESVATDIDMSQFETNGKIIETYADGSTKTTTIEFDESGLPIKITDGNGNVTTLTWETPTFTIGGKSYQFESGMTWGAWVASAYNTDGYVVSGTVIQPKNDTSVAVYNGSTEVKNSDSIISGNAYTVQSY